MTTAQETAYPVDNALTAYIDAGGDYPFAAGVLSRALDTNRADIAVKVLTEAAARLQYGAVYAEPEERGAYLRPEEEAAR